MYVCITVALPTNVSSVSDGLRTQRCGERFGLREEAKLHVDEIHSL